MLLSSLVKTETNSFQIYTAAQKQYQGTNPQNVDQNYNHTNYKISKINVNDNYLFSCVSPNQYNTFQRLQNSSKYHFLQYHILPQDSTSLPRPRLYTCKVRLPGGFLTGLSL
jgi:hypothetical protein